MFESPAVWVVVAVVVLALVAAVVLLRRDDVMEVTGIAQRRRRPHRDDFRPEGVEGVAVPPKRAGVIVNPTKYADVQVVRDQVTTSCAAQGWGEPLWYETTVADPGTGQARRAVADGAAVVCALGGDGTVRAVASALVGTQTPLGLLPGGTGNLLARNLELPVDSLDKALVVALTGQNARIDVGRLEVDPSGQHAVPDEHFFFVMAGIGFDAEIMAGAGERLKSRVGYGAYVVSGCRTSWARSSGPGSASTGGPRSPGAPARSSSATPDGCSAGWCSCRGPDSTTGCSTRWCCRRGGSWAGRRLPVTSSPVSGAATA